MHYNRLDLPTLFSPRSMCSVESEPRPTDSVPDSVHLTLTALSLSREQSSSLFLFVSLAGGRASADRGSDSERQSNFAEREWVRAARHATVDCHSIDLALARHIASWLFNSISLSPPSLHSLTH